MLRKLLTLLILIPMESIAMADESSTFLFDFAADDAIKQWQSVNDGVMGGVSEGTCRITDQKTLVFLGKLSLENNGGFASIRSRGRKLGLQKGDTLLARVRGDGREYSLNLYVDKPLVAFSYRASLPTKKDEWIEVKVPLEKFEATSFGRVVKDFGTVPPGEVNSLGFLIGDKIAGPFKLEIEWIKVLRVAK